MRLLLTAIIFWPLSNAAFAQGEPSPQGDMAILRLYQASITCAVIQEVNPEAVGIESTNYFRDAVSLYALYHNMPEGESEIHQEGWMEIRTGETAIKAQGLRSTAMASDHLRSFLEKANVSSCNEVRISANDTLSHYGLSLP